MLTISPLADQLLFLQYSVQKFSNTNSMALRQIHRRYSNSRFISNALSYCKNSRTAAPTNPIQESISKTPFSVKLTTINDDPIFPNPEVERKYYESINNREIKRWFHNPKGVGSTIFFFTCGVVLAVASGAWITVPYTGRTHFVLFYKYLRKILPDELNEIEGEALYPLHPDSVTARRIIRDTIEQASQIQAETKRPYPFQLESFKGRKFEIKINFQFPDEYQENGIDSEKCQVIVVDSPVMFDAAVSRSFRKVYVTTATLHYYRNHEAMMATKLGHDVGHILAKHAEEVVSKFISLASGVGMTLYLFYQSAYIRSKCSSYLLHKFMRRRFLPSFSFVASLAIVPYLPMMKYKREMELEADYIGLMLAASAKYNPAEGRLFPINFGNEKKLLDCFYKIPSGKERVEHLSMPQVIGEAHLRYNRAQRRCLTTKGDSS